MILEITFSYFSIDKILYLYLSIIYYYYLLFIIYLIKNKILEIKILDFEEKKIISKSFFKIFF